MAKKMTEQDKKEKQTGADFKKSKFEARTFVGSTVVELVKPGLISPIKYRQTAEPIIISDFSSIFRPPKA
jgi:hypothetical protein